MTNGLVTGLIFFGAGMFTGMALTLFGIWVGLGMSERTKR